MSGANGGRAWREQARALALERFRAMSWPTPEEEEWRRTDLHDVDLDSWVALGPAAGVGLAGTAAGATGTAGTGTAGAGPGATTAAGAAGRLVLKAGRVTHREVSHPWQEQGVKLLSLDQSLDGQEPVVRELFSTAVQEADNRFIAWHYAALTHGVLLYVPPFVEIPSPFLIELHETSGAGGAGAEARRYSAPHIVILLAEGARATVITSIEGDGEVLYNAASDARVGAAGALRWYESQAVGERALYFRHARIRVDRDAMVEHLAADLGGRILKTRVDCSLAGPGSEAYLNGVYFPRGTQHMDIRTVQRHCSPRATSRALYKGAVRDSARAVFQGLIEVSPGASGTDAFLTNRNLILNDGARADSIPSLRIGNNDVKCSHGSTVGRVSEEELFYLMSRGLPREEARELIVTGYFEDLLAKTPAEFGQAVLSLMRSRLAAPLPARELPAREQAAVPA